MPNRLDWRKKPDVHYAVPLWLRDEQIKHALRAVPGRIQPQYDKRPESIAVVGYGPSLQDTWEQIRDFPYVMSCSGAHRFLIEKGIVPQWHVEVDPREHKVGLMGPPHERTEYLIASTCHPKVFEHLKGFNVKLWHVFDASDDGVRMLPPGEWAVTGGCDVGLRAMTLAAFLGFRDLHVFGIDGCARDGRRHAANHPYTKQNLQEVEYPDHSGVLYYTTPAMLAAARETTHELKQMPGVKATFYGDGLTQAMVKDFKQSATAPTKPLAEIVGSMRLEVISPEYVALNEQLHRDNLAYGVGGGKYADTVKKLCESMKTTSVLDYGCGKGYLAKELSFPIWEYDPAIAGKKESPRPADIVVCTDVLEHIEPDKLKGVLADLHRVMRQIGYFVIHTGPASKTLPDGRNTHLLQRDAEWWKKTLKKFFQVAYFKEVKPHLYVMVIPKHVKVLQAA